MAGRKLNVLLYSEGWGNGGIESFITNLIKVVDKEKFSFDVFCTHDTDSIYDKMLNNQSISRYVVFKGYKPNLIKRLFASTKAWRNQLSQKRYDAVHINTMNGIGFIYAAIAERAGVPVRIVHSHNSRFGCGMESIKQVAHRLGRALWQKSATVQLACSQDAGKYLFEDTAFSVLPNAIDVDRFRYSRENRKTMRSKLNVGEGEILLGNLGRLSEAKNPLFQLDIFSEFLQDNPEAKYLMVGKGELDEVVSDFIQKKNLTSSVIRIDGTDRPEDVYSALDAFLMPSLFEGLAMTCVEAQCNGLPVLASDKITQEVDLTDLVKHESLKSDKRLWAKDIGLLIRIKRQREFYADRINEKGYSLKDLSTRFESIYANECIITEG